MYSHVDVTGTVAIKGAEPVTVTGGTASATLTPAEEADVTGSVDVAVNDDLYVWGGTATATLTPSGPADVTGTVGIKGEEAVEVTVGSVEGQLNPTTQAEVGGFVTIDHDKEVTVTNGTAAGVLTADAVALQGTVAIKPEEPVTVTGGAITGMVGVSGGLTVGGSVIVEEGSEVKVEGGTIGGFAEPTGAVGISGKVNIAGGETVHVTGGSVSGSPKVSGNVDIDILPKNRSVLAHIDADETINVKKENIPITLPSFNAQVKGTETISVTGGETVGLTLDSNSSKVNLPTAEADRQITVTGGVIPVTMDQSSVTANLSGNPEVTTVEKSDIGVGISGTPTVSVTAGQEVDLNGSPVSLKVDHTKPVQFAPTGTLTANASDLEVSADVDVGFVETTAEASVVSGEKIYVDPNDDQLSVGPNEEIQVSDTIDLALSGTPSLTPTVESGEEVDISGSDIDLDISSGKVVVSGEVCPTSGYGTIPLSFDIDEEFAITLPPVNVELDGTPQIEFEPDEDYEINLPSSVVVTIPSQDLSVSGDVSCSGTVEFDATSTTNVTLTGGDKVIAPKESNETSDLLIRKKPDNIADCP